ncbi:MAG: type II toxin-antitoxin system HigB family toxin [Bryobacterales bacterium]
MRVISRRALRDFAVKHPDSTTALDQWLRITRRADWSSLTATQRDFNHAEAVGRLTVFNIKGNRYRLIARVNYRTQRVFVRHILTHEEYERGKWKE